MSFQIGDSGREVGDFTDFLNRKFSAYSAIKRDEKYGLDEARVVAEAMRRYGLPPTFMTIKLSGVDTRVEGAIATDEFLLRAAYRAPGPAGPVIAPVRPIGFSAEGHMSNMFFGPAADTATQLESEGLCYHKPLSYNSNALPFDNDSLVNELVNQLSRTLIEGPPGVLWPFPAGTSFFLDLYSQGAIGGSYFYFDYLAPGKPLNWRLKDMRGVLAYGNPCRQKDSIAPWALPLIKKAGTHGLDPTRRFGMDGFPVKPDNWMDVYREGDIFAENGDDKASEMKAAIYEAVMGNFFSSPVSLAWQIAGVFKEPISSVIGIVMAIVSGISFLADNPNPHYAPYELQGGIDWMRGRLTSGAALRAS